MRPCGHLFQVLTTSSTAPCFCGRESIGQCLDCGNRLCGLHGTGGAEFLCESCRVSRGVQKQIREEEASRDHELGLIDFGDSLRSTGQGGRLSLRDVWIAVAAAIRAKNPPADIAVLDECRIAELPSRWPELRGRAKKRERIQTEWNAAVDRLAVPAWDTKATLRAGSGVADTFSLDEHPLYFGSNGVLYCNPSGPTPNGTHTRGRTYRSAVDVPGVWSSRWAPAGASFYPRQEVADALANLVAVHGLSLDI
jgi:hypothetical protein